MSLTQLKDKAAHLPSKEQRELIAFLVALQTAKDEAFKEKLAAKIDDREPANWVDLEDLPKLREHLRSERSLRPFTPAESREAFGPDPEWEQHEAAMACRLVSKPEND